MRGKKKNVRKGSRLSIALLLVAIGGFAGWTLFGGDSGKDAGHGAGEVVTVYKSVSCGCCSGWVSHLRREGFEVVTKNVEDMNSVKADHGVPAGTQSCHTAVVDGYVVEGHIPAEVIQGMLAERPDIAGIALPGMPDGSPGMPGRKTVTWEVVAFNDAGATELYTTY